MTDQLQILCIGAALWDIIGRTPAPMRVGSDVAGRITRIPGGVALNIAMALVRAGARPEVLAAVGQDPAGDALVAEMAARGVGVDHLYRAPDLPTDTYMAMEGRRRANCRHCRCAFAGNGGGPRCLRPCATGDWPATRSHGAA